MIANDKAIAETNDARNSLESYVLEMRSKLDSELKDYILPAENETFCKVLMDYEDWLMDEEGSQKSEYKKRLAELQKTGGPVEQRKREFDRREEFCKEFRFALGKWTTLSESKEEKYAHIPAEERKGVTDSVAAAEQWLQQQLAAQVKNTESIPPSLSSIRIPFCFCLRAVPKAFAVTFVCFFTCLSLPLTLISGSHGQAPRASFGDSQDLAK